MEITLSRKSLGKAIVLSWVTFAIIWQISLLFYYPLQGSNLIRFIIMIVKPLFLSAMIFSGHSWPRVAIGILGPLTAFFILMIGVIQFDDEGLGSIISIGGAIIYSALSIAVMVSKSVDRACR